MGACATKPKVLKADSGEAPAPPPEDPATAVIKLENDSDGKTTEIVDVDVDDDKVDSKSRSLSNLFGDQKEGIKEKTAADPSEKQEIPPAEAEEKPSEANPPPSDSVTDKTISIISDEAVVVETPSEEKKENDPKNPQQIIEDNLKVEVSNENNPPPETEKEEVKVITN